MNYLASFGRLVFFLLFLCCLLGNRAIVAQGVDPALTKLQSDFAIRFLEPEPHMALAKYYFDHGNLLEAFYTVEAARQGRFEEKIFNPAFYRAFDGFDNSGAAEARLLGQHKLNPGSIETIDGLADIYISRADWPKARHYLGIALQMKPEEFRFTSGLATVMGSEGKPEDADRIVKDYAHKYPESLDGYRIRVDELIETNPVGAKVILSEALGRFPAAASLQFDRGILFQQEQNLAKAEEAFLKAAELAPTSVYIQSWVGRFLFKVKEDNAGALKYYLNAYFLDPHAYESEFVESRIRKINFQLAAAKVEEQIASGGSLTGMLNDPNPLVAGLALEKMAESWRPVYVDQLVRVMGHDNQNLRWQATQMLKKNVDKSFDERLTALLKDDDQRKRGLAAYIAVFRWKSASFGLMKGMLAENSQLVRFDALSALMLEGGEAGRQIVLAHAPRESNPILKKLIQSARAPKER